MNIMQCPICSSYGLLLIIVGFTVIFLSTFYSILVYPGLGIIISAYFVPSLLTKYTKKGAGCKLPEPESK